MYFTRNISEAVNQISELLFHCDLFLISLIIIFKMYLLTYRDRVQLRPVHTGGKKMNVSLWLCCVKVTPCQIHLQAKNGKWLKAAAWWNPPPAEWGTRKWDFFYELCNWKKFQEHKVRRWQKDRGLFIILTLRMWGVYQKVIWINYWFTSWRK